MPLKAGDKLLAVHRRLFKDDASRYFVGLVEAYADGIARVAGISWVWEPFTDQVLAKEGLRRKLISINSGAIMAYVLDPQVRLEDVYFRHDPDGSTWLLDKANLKLDMSEKARRQT